MHSPMGILGQGKKKLKQNGPCPKSYHVTGTLAGERRIGEWGQL